MVVLDLNNYQKQHSLAIDMVANCIIHERRRGMNPKAIILSSAYYDMLRKWVHDTYGEETAQKEFFLDTVEIRREKIYSGKSLLIEYWKPETSQA